MQITNFMLEGMRGVLVLKLATVLAFILQYLGGVE